MCAAIFNFINVADDLTIKMIQAKNISKSYGNLKVVDQAELIIDQPSIVSIVGKSGAGKSTLLHILGTLEKPDSGEIFINRINISSYSEKKLAVFRNLHIGFIFQFHHLLDEFTALENAAMPALIKGESKNVAFSKAKELLDYLGLQERLQHKPAQLSGGEQQRVAAARALINRPAVIFADEPTGNLDTANSTEMHHLFQKMCKDFDQTFIIVTHNTDLAQLSDARYEMVNGKLILQS